jgi:hypothetical protein
MSQPARDPIGDFQRWLMKAGARSLSREVANTVRTTLGGGASANKHASVWETATTEPPGDEPPECQWCPICRAARRYRDSGSTATPDIGSQLAGVGDVLAGFTKDAFSLFEAAVRNPQRPPGSPNAPGTATPSIPGAASDDGPVVGPRVTWAAAVVHAEDEDSEPADKGGHAEEDGEPGETAADSGGDEQVEGSAE